MYTASELEALHAAIPEPDVAETFVLNNRAVLDVFQAWLDRDDFASGFMHLDSKEIDEVTLHGGATQAGLLLALAEESGIDIAITLHRGRRGTPFVVHVKCEPPKDGR